MKKVGKNTLFITNGSTIDDLIINNPDINEFIFDKGEFYMNKKILINRPNISFLGMGDAKDTHIFQINPEQDGLDIEANKFVMKNLSLHVTAPGKVAISVAGCNGTNISMCYIYGNPTTFTIFFAGPQVSAGLPTLDAYNKSELDSNNSLFQNVIYSMWSGDSISFSLQKNGSVKNNIVRGGKIAVYMCQDCDIMKNTIYDSTSSGIFISLPSHHVKLRSNKIYECTESGIKVGNQKEHGDFEKSEYGLEITNNYIYDVKTNAIELNDVDKMILNYNRFVSSDRHGIYALRCNNLDIYKNRISYFSVAFYLEITSNSQIRENELYSIYPFTARHVVKMVNQSNNNSITKNNVYGKISNDQLYHEVGNSVSNEINDNIHSEYYSYRDELTVMKFK